MNFLNDILVISLYCLFIELSAASNSCVDPKNRERKLVEDLFDPYDYLERPVLSDRPIEVSVTLKLAGIQEIIELERLIILHGYFEIIWQDDIHIWNTTFPHNCTPGVAVPSEIIWLPDICLVNSAKRYSISSKRAEKAYIYSNGTVEFSPGGDFKVYCEFDLKYFPYDRHTCTLHLESWSNKIHQQVFSINSRFDIQNFIQHSQWYLEGGYASLPASKSEQLPWYEHDRFFIHMTIRRKFMYYGVNIIFPSTIIAAANLVTFMMPPNNARKLGIAITCLLALSIFQRIVAAEMPRTSDTTPMILVYFVLQMAYICFSMIGHGFVVILLNKTNVSCNHCELPEMSPRSLGIVKRIGYFVCLKMSQDCADSEKCQWVYAAGVLDRFVFAMYFLLSVTTALVMLLIHPLASGGL